MESLDTLKKQIDSMTTEQMLETYRFSDASPIVCGEGGAYLIKMMHERRASMPHEEWAAISKKVGWETSPSKNNTKKEGNSNEDEKRKNVC